MEHGEGREPCRKGCLAEVVFSGILADGESRAVATGAGTLKVKTGAFEDSVVVWEDAR